MLRSSMKPSRRIQPFLESWMEFHKGFWQPVGADRSCTSFLRMGEFFDRRAGAALQRI
jgi:hypothetical protein